MCNWYSFRLFTKLLNRLLHFSSDASYMEINEGSTTKGRYEWKSIFEWSRWLRSHLLLFSLLFPIEIFCFGERKDENTSVINSKSFRDRYRASRKAETLGLHSATIESCHRLIRNLAQLIKALLSWRFFLMFVHDLMAMNCRLSTWHSSKSNEELMKEMWIAWTVRSRNIRQKTVNTTFFRRRDDFQKHFFLFALELFAVQF